MRTSALVPLALAATLAAGCTDVLPCTTCPKLEGTWQLTHTPGERTADCATLVPATPPATATFTRAGARVTGTVGTTSVVGTVYDTWQFVITGEARELDGGVVGVELRGRYDENRSDGGLKSEALHGTFTTRETRAGKQCDADNAFVGGR